MNIYRFYISCIPLILELLLVVRANVIDSSQNRANLIHSDAKSNVQRISAQHQPLGPGPSMLSTIAATLSKAPNLVSTISDPASIYLQPAAHAAIGPSTIPLNSLRSILRRVYFTYQFYYPEMRLGMCLMRSAGRVAEEPVYEELATMGADSGLDVDEKIESVTAADAITSQLLQRRRRRAAVDNQAELGANLRGLFEHYICRDSTDQMCQTTMRNRRPFPAAQLDEATLQVYRSIALNMLERWMSQRPVMRAMLSGPGGRRMRRFAGIVAQSVVRRMRDMVPGVYGCTQQYFAEMLWRTLETWI